MDMELAALAEEVEAALVLKAELADRALSVINGLSGDLVIEREDLDSTDKVLSVIYAAKPGWSVSMRGNASMPNGHWRCTLRQTMSHPMRRP